MTDAEPDRPQGRDGNEGGQQEKITGTRKQLIEASDNPSRRRKPQAENRRQSISHRGGDQREKVGSKHALEAGQEIHLKAGMKVIIEAGTQLTIKGPGGFADIGPAGVTIKGTMVLINSGGSAGSGSGSKPASAEDAKPAQPTDRRNLEWRRSKIVNWTTRQSVGVVYEDRHPLMCGSPTTAAF
ncbi:MAG: hypothetical protein WCC08_03060 [Terrimicrobiaceae bacterium]